MDETITKFTTLTLTVTAPQLVEAKKLTVSISSIKTHRTQTEIVRKVQFDSGSITIVTSWSPGVPTSNLALTKLNIPVKLLCDRLILKCLLRPHKHSTYKPLQQYRIIKSYCAITLSSSQPSSIRMLLHSLNSTIEFSSSLQPVSTMPSPGQQLSSIMPLPSLNATAELSSHLQPVSTTSSSSHLTQTTTTPSSNQQLATAIDSMGSLSKELHQNANKKSRKFHRSRPEIARKVIAFQELIASKSTKISKRDASGLLEVPNSTMQSWVDDQTNNQANGSEKDIFFSTAVGVECLNRILHAAHTVIHYSSGGVRADQEFLRLSGLDRYVASSDGALQAFSVRSEEHLVVFGSAQEAKGAKTMKKRKITAGLDEMFRKRFPCLVAMEVVSGFLLLEKFTEDRKAETWTKELKPRLDELNVELKQVVSDLSGGIRASAGELGAEHIPELFHAQQEISKGTSAPLNAKERAAEKSLAEAETNLEKAIKKHGEGSEQAKKAKSTRDLHKIGLEKRKERCLKVRTANKALSKAIHPIDLDTGELQTTDKVKSRCEEQFTIIETVVKESDLSKSCQERIKKARRAFEGIFKSMSMFFNFSTAFIKALDLETNQEKFFNDVIFPLSYLKMIWKRLTGASRKELQPLMNSLEAKMREESWDSELKEEWMKKGKDLAESFQRSSSCVEGRNGRLSLYYHRFHRLNERSLRALTVVHNFHIKRADQTTAAERFFGMKHDDLFESLVQNVKIPGKPRKQYHDPEKRQSGRLKRKSA